MANPTITKCLIGEARMNFAHVFTPDSFDDKSEPKYSVVLSFPQSDKKLYATIEAAINECAEKAKAQYGGALPKKFNILQKVTLYVNQTTSYYSLCCFAH